MYKKNEGDGQRGHLISNIEWKTCRWKVKTMGLPPTYASKATEVQNIATIVLIEEDEMVEPNLSTDTFFLAKNYDFSGRPMSIVSFMLSIIQMTLHFRIGALDWHWTRLSVSRCPLDGKSFPISLAMPNSCVDDTHSFRFHVHLLYICMSITFKL